MSRVKDLAKQSGGCAKTFIEDSADNVKKTVDNAKVKKNNKLQNDILDKSLKTSENLLELAYIADQVNPSKKTKSDLAVKKANHLDFIKQKATALGSNKEQDIGPTMSKIEKRSRTTVNSQITARKEKAKEEKAKTPADTYKAPSKSDVKRTKNFFENKRKKKDDGIKERKGREPSKEDDPDFDPDGSVKKKGRKDSRSQRLSRRKKEAKNVKS